MSDEKKPQEEEKKEIKEGQSCSKDHKSSDDDWGNCCG